MRHRLKWFIHLRAQGLRKGNEHPDSTPLQSACYTIIYPNPTLYKAGSDITISHNSYGITITDARNYGYLLVLGT